MTKALVFDMDGTIADLYGVDNWLDCLRSENPMPYIMAQPLVEMNVLNSLLECLKKQGWTVIVTSWLSKGSSKEYDKVVRTAKKDWLNRYSFPYDEIHLVKYGTTKASCTRKYDRQILIDDNADVRKGFENLAKGRSTINANEDIILKLAELLLTE